MRSDIVPGTTFPDYELPDHTTKRRKLLNAYTPADRAADHWTKLTLVAISFRKKLLSAKAVPGRAIVQDEHDRRKR